MPDDEEMKSVNTLYNRKRMIIKTTGDILPTNPAE